MSMTPKISSFERSLPLIIIALIRREESANELLQQRKMTEHNNNDKIYGKQIKHSCALTPQNYLIIEASSLSNLAVKRNFVALVESASFKN